MMCSRAEVNLRDVREGFLAERDFPRLTQAAGQIAGSAADRRHLGSFHPATARPGAAHVAAKPDQAAGHRLPSARPFRHPPRQGTTGSRRFPKYFLGIKALAKELEIPIIILSQLNRDVEKDKSRKPKLSDLRESGAIEQDADLVGLLYKPSTGDDDESVPRDEPGGIPVSLLIAKADHGRRSPHVP